MAADCLQSLRAEIEATHRFVMPAPSARTETFACLQVKVGPYTLLVPVDQVRRIEQVEKFNRFAGVSLPGLDATNYLLLIDVDLPGIYVDAVEGITRIEPDDVLWRRPSKRSPWFVGTHTTSLSRVFDPIYFLQRTRIDWR
jgi:chemotaxis signal transduction protein